MDIGIISNRYAKALHRFAEENNEADRVYTEMQALASAFLQTKSLRHALNSPVVSSSDKKKLLTAAAAGDSAPTRSAERFFELLVKNKRADLAQFMAQAYLSRYRQAKHLVPARLLLAGRVSEETEKSLRQLVEKRTRGQVEFQTTIAPHIGGGFILEYDTYRLDASLKSQLETLHRSMRG